MRDGGCPCLVFAMVAAGLLSGTTVGAEELEGAIPELCLMPWAKATVSDGFKAAGFGLDRLSRGDVEAAVACLQFAHRLMPDSEVVARDLGLAYAQAGKLDQAQQNLQAARQLGDRGGDLALALVYGEIGDRDQARVFARRAGGIEGETIAALLGDGKARRQLMQSLPTVGAERPLARLVLALRAAQEGSFGAAVHAARHAQTEAEIRRDSLVLNAARALRARLRQRRPWDVRARVAVKAEHLYNPLWLGNEQRGVRSAAATRVIGAVNATGDLGAVRWEAGIMADQRLFVTDRDHLGLVERLGMLGYGAVSIPLSDDFRSAQLRIGMQALEVRSESFRRSLGTALEGGPTLQLSVAHRWQVELGIYGIWTNFPEAEARDLGRDRVGQRARGAVRYATSRLVGEFEVVGMNDGAVGQVFSAVGASMAGRLYAQVSRRWRARTAASVLVRRWGPVGNEAVVGSTLQQTEARWTLSTGLTRRWSHTFLGTIDSVLVRNEGAVDGRYVAHEVQIGMEAQW